MKKILIYGLKEPIGGVEKIITLYTDNFPDKEIACDYIIFGTSFSLETKIREKGGRVFYLPNRIKRRKEYFEKLNSIFLENKYDVVWANFPGLTNIDVIKLGKKYGVPVRIAHSHGSSLFWSGIIMKYPVILFHNINKPKIDKYATDFWACSEKAGEFMFPKKLHGKIRVINNAVDTSVFFKDCETRNKTRKELGVENDLVVCHVARMSPEKNQGFLLEVFEKLLQKQSNSKLLFVGDGELKEQLYKKARELGIIDNIIFVGFKEDASAYYKASDVFLLTSLSEGLSLVTVEAQACGVPCVVSRGVPKIADVTGFVEFVGLDKSPEEWADAILEMSDKEIPDPSSAVKKAGYDIKAAAERVYQFFIDGYFAD